MVHRTSNGVSDVGGPVRTCIGCRQRDSADHLVRIVACPDGPDPIAVDIRRTLPGRGAWLHPVPDCVSAALRRRAFGPALRSRGMEVDRNDLAELLGEIATNDPALDQDR